VKLYIGNKNYSSWSLRPWLLMRQSGIGFDEVRLRLDFDAGSAFRAALAGITPTAKVPVLVDDDGFAVWDTLAITEYLAERFPDKQLWPADRLSRARARSLCAEMHAGFGALREHCPMNVEASLPAVGARLLRELPAVGTDLARIVQMWQTELERSGGPFLFAAFSAADAYFAPVASRIATYALAVPPSVSAYVARVLELPAMAEWSADARAEHDFLPFDEPYRERR